MSQPGTSSECAVRPGSCPPAKTERRNQGGISKSGGRQAAGPGGGLHQAGRLAGHDEARLQQGHVKALAVKADHRIQSVEQLAQGLELGRFLAIVAHKELVDDELVVLKDAHAYQKGIGARATGQPGGLGIDKSHPAEIHFSQVLVAGQERSTLRGMGQQIGQGMIAVALVELVAFVIQKIRTCGVSITSPESKFSMARRRTAALTADTPRLRPRRLSCSRRSEFPMLSSQYARASPGAVPTVL